MHSTRETLGTPQSERGITVADASPRDALIASFTGASSSADRAREDFAFYVENVVKDELTKDYITLADHHFRIIEEALLDDTVRVVFLELFRGAGKALANGTPIPTTHGWRFMGDLKVGDTVFDEEGRPTEVTGVFPQGRKDGYRLQFSDNTSIVASSDHLWVTLDGRDRARRNAWFKDTGRYRGQSRARRDLLYKGWTDTPAITTQQIAETLHTDWARPDLNHCIPLAMPLQTPDADLPIDPYLFGLWLGDGASSAGIIAADHNDALYYETEARRAGEPWRLTTDNGNAGSYVLNHPKAEHHAGRMSESFTARLRALGVLGDKRVPAIYLRASFEQRLALLRGLMDSDGTIDVRKSVVEFTSTSSVLADNLKELATTLGERPTLGEGRATLYGKDCGPKYRVLWRPKINPFALPRKANLFTEIGGVGQASRHFNRTIIAVEPIAPTGMTCITVAAQSQLFLAGEGMVPTHNSTIVNAFLTWLGSKNPAMRIILAAKTDDQASIQMRGIEELLASPDHINVFGDLIPSQIERKTYSYVWNSQEKALVVRDDDGVVQRMGRHPTYTAVGAGSDLVAGRRSDLIVIDDIIAEKVAYSPATNAHVADWVFRTLFFTRVGRAKTIIIGTPYADGDFYDMVLEEMGGRDWFRHIRIPAYLVEGEEEERITDPTTGRHISAWPERFPVEDLVQKEEENFWAFNSQMMLLKFDASQSQFKREWLKTIHEDDIPPLEEMVLYMGIDPAGMKGSKTADRLAMAVLGIHEEKQGFLLEMATTKGDKEETLLEICRFITQYQPAAVFVEVAGNQDHFLEWLKLELRGRLNREPNFNPVDSGNIPKPMRLKSMSNYFINGSVLLRGVLNHDTGALIAHPSLDRFVQEWIVYRGDVAGHDDALDAANIALTPFYSHTKAFEVVIIPGSHDPRNDTRTPDQQVEDALINLKREAAMRGVSPTSMLANPRGMGRILDRGGSPPRLLR